MADPARVTWTVAEGVRLVADAHGDPAAPPVLLLHGGGQTRHAWGDTAQSLAARGWLALAIDQRGHGESDWAPDGDYGLDAFASDLRAVAATCHARPVIVGASLGGMAALVAEGERSGVAEALVLVDIAPSVQPAGVSRIVDFMTAHPEGFASLEAAAAAVADFLSHRARPADPRGLRKNLRLGADGRYRWHWDPELMSGARGVNVRKDPGRLDRAARALRLPTLLVRGRLSDVVSEDDARAFLAAVPHACYADVSGAGHMVAGDRNDRFTAAVVEFLEGLRRAPASGAGR